MANWDVLIRGGDIVTPEGVERLDIAIEAGAIAELAPELSGDARETIEATGLHVFPGLIDPHVHFNEPGRTDWEGFATGSSALAAGGGTCFFDMPLNSSPPTLDAASFDLKRVATQASSRTDFALWGGLTPGNLDRMEELAEHGVIGFKAFMCNSGIEDFPKVDDAALWFGMRKAKQLGLPVAVHAENDTLAAAFTQMKRSSGKRTMRDYIDSRPWFVEVEAIGRAITFARASGCDLHIVHVSTPQGVEAVAEAKRAGVSVTCETCAHYLLLSEEDACHIGAPAKCAPPLRHYTEQSRLQRLLHEGAIDFVASDHSPAPASMKAGDDVFGIWGGIAGVQSTLAGLLSFRPRLPLPLDLVGRLAASNAAHRFAIARKGRIAPGFDADLALIDAEATYALTRDMLLDRHKLSPYVGRTFHGLVKRTIARGRTIFADGKMVGDDHRGRLIKPTRKA
jgi:allantoinase